MLSIISSAFEPNGPIPSLYTCDSENKNPPLIISGVPQGAKSLTLILEDPDIPQAVQDALDIKIFDHWVVFNMPSDTVGISEAGTVPGIEGTHSSGSNGYIGPCPPDREHRYFFKLYALDTMLDLKAGVTRKEVEKAMEGHVIARAELIGRYDRAR